MATDQFDVAAYDAAKAKARGRHRQMLEAAEQAAILPHDHLKRVFVQLYADHLNVHMMWRYSAALNVLLSVVLGVLIFI